jgi:hypothetical protein
MSVVKKITCDCGTEYLGVISKTKLCPTCEGIAPDIAKWMQDKLKQYTYLEDHIVLHKILLEYAMLANAPKPKDIEVPKIEASGTAAIEEKIEAAPKPKEKGFFGRWFNKD